MKTTGDEAWQRMNTVFAAEKHEDSPSKLHQHEESVHLKLHASDSQFLLSLFYGWWVVTSCVRASTNSDALQLILRACFQRL